MKGNINGVYVFAYFVNFPKVRKNYKRWFVHRKCRIRKIWLGSPDSASQWLEISCRPSHQWCALAEKKSVNSKLRGLFSGLQALSFGAATKLSGVAALSWRNGWGCRRTNDFVFSRWQILTCTSTWDKQFVALSSQPARWGRFSFVLAVLLRKFVLFLKLSSFIICVFRVIFSSIFIFECFRACSKVISDWFVGNFLTLLSAIIRGKFVTWQAQFWLNQRFCKWFHPQDNIK